MSKIFSIDGIDHIVGDKYCACSESSLDLVAGARSELYAHDCGGLIHSSGGQDRARSLNGRASYHNVCDKCGWESRS